MTYDECTSLQGLLRDYRASFFLSPAVDHHAVMTLKNVSRRVARWRQYYDVEGLTPDT